MTPASVGVRAAVIVVGTELTQGLTRESNSIFLSRWLRERGITVIAVQKTPDDIGLIASAINFLSSQAELVILTGGLGSTHDDVTREALAEVLGVPLVRHDPAYQLITEAMPPGADSESFLRQAYLPQGAQAMITGVGTAPGVSFEWRDTMLFALPGVPKEMEVMLAQVEAELEGKALVGAPPPMARAGLIGASEPEVARLIAPVLEAYPEVTANILATPEQISLTLMDLRGGSAVDESLVQSAFEDMLVRLGKLVFSASGASLPEVVGILMRDIGLTLATAESVTAGQIGVLVASVAGASDYFLGGVTSYANEAKESLLGVQKATIEQSGAVSEETAIAMAEGARRVLGADIGLAVTGVAGPGGARPEKPVGLVYTSLALPDRTMTFKDVHRGDRGSVQQRAAFRALDHLRRSLIGEGADG